MNNIFEKLITPEMIMDYKSPIEVMVGEMVMQYENDILKAVQDVDIDVDKDELLKALRYDRDQYEKGYADARENVIDKFVAEAMKDFTEFDLKHGYPTVVDCKVILRDVAERMKNETN